MTRANSTNAIHGRRETGARPVTYPIYQTAAFYVDSPDGFAHLNDYADDEFFYTRYSNPTIRGVEEKLATLEHAEEALLFASGMNAITTSILALLQSGDTIAVSRVVYGGTFAFFRTHAPRFGINVVFLDEDQLYEVEKHAPDAKIVYFETPVNPRCNCVSIRRVVEAARRIGALVVKDNTFASPVNQTPLDFGVDIVLHSATKYLGGHADITGGLAVGSRELLAKLYAARKVYGGVISPHDAFLLDRSLKTLELRMAQHNASAMTLAQFFEDEPKVKQVDYPGLSSSPDHAVAKEQMRGYSGMLCITLDSLDAARAFCDHLNIALNVAHLGTAETLVCIPALTSHSMLSEEEMRKMGLAPGMVRISAGLEHVDDLIGDFKGALVKV